MPIPVGYDTYLSTAFGDYMTPPPADKQVPHHDASQQIWIRVTQNTWESIMQEKISVIVPVYNVEAYLERCVESILKQTYSNLEILLVNDGSTDKSGELCDQLALRDTRISSYS